MAQSGLGSARNQPRRDGFGRAGEDRGGNCYQEGANRPETAMEILQKRYARGDISKDEYEQKRRDLSP